VRVFVRVAAVIVRAQDLAFIRTETIFVEDLTVTRNLSRLPDVTSLARCSAVIFLLRAKFEVILSAVMGGSRLVVHVAITQIDIILVRAARFL
jgi:hypothetical protein